MTVTSDSNHTQDIKSSKRIQVLFSPEQYQLLQAMKGEMGMSDAEVVKNIVMAWLLEKSFISTSIKKKIEKYE